MKIVLGLFHGVSEYIVILHEGCLKSHTEFFFFFLISCHKTIRLLFKMALGSLRPKREHVLGVPFYL